MAEISSEVIMDALAEIRRRQIVHAKFQEGTSDLYEDAFIYAIANSVYPLFHSDVSSYDSLEENLGVDPFLLTYRVSHDQIKELLDYLDKDWLNKKVYTYYQIQDKFKLDRINLIRCLRYTFLSDRFDSAFWDKLLSDAPVEAHNITEEFSLDRIYL